MGTENFKPSLVGPHKLTKPGVKKKLKSKKFFFRSREKEKIPSGFTVLKA